MKEVNVCLNFRTLKIVMLLRANKNSVILLDSAKVRCEALGMTPDVHLAVRLPHHVGEFCDDVSLDGGPAAQACNLIFQRFELVRLCCRLEGVKVGKKRVVLIICEALFKPLRHGDFAPVETSREPPRSFLRDKRQTPVAEF